MESRYMLEQPSRVAGKDFSWRPEDTGPMAAAAAFTNGPVFFSSRVMDGGGGGGGGGGGSVEGKSERSSPPGNGLPPGGRLRPHDVEKAGLGDQKESGSSGILKRSSPTHCPAVSGQLQGVFMHLDIRTSGRPAELATAFRAAPGRIAPPAERQPLPSSHIPVPRNRKPSGHADKEVMAATVLTSLSTSPLVLHPSCAPTVVPEPAGRAWKEVLSASYSSSTSGNWSWDASDQSVPSTPSPPLSNDANKNFLLSSHCDDAIEDASESTHFMFEDPIPRKRKNSMKVMFKCLWKNCDKVLSTSSGIQRHVRTVHLGRSSDSDYSDGEEDFYYSEIEVNVDSLTEGLSSLTPTSPTTCGPPPVFPPPLATATATAVPHSEHINVSQSQSHAPTLLSQSAPSTLCHIRTDHAYQATAPMSVPVGPEPAGLDGSGTGTGTWTGSGTGTRSGSGSGTGTGVSVSWQSSPVIFKGVPGPVTHVRTVCIGEKRQPAPGPHAVANGNGIKNHSTTPAPKPTAGTRKPRGEAKKCRKVYGMEKRDMWCTACRWKKACQRFTD